MLGVCLKGVGSFNHDSYAICLPGQGASAFLRVPHRQDCGAPEGRQDSMEKLATERS